MSENFQQQTSGEKSNNWKKDNELYVVGIGASAGGLSALEELFGNLSTNSGAAFVVIQHLSPDFKSLMKELLERHTSMPIYRVTEGMRLERDSVYLIPPGQNLALEQDILRLEDRRVDKNNKHELNFPIDLFFNSLAKNYGEKSVGVILSGSGSDGTRGLKTINEEGGVALVQDPDTAEFDGMPSSAIATGIVHQILPPRELSQLIYQCVTASVDSLETEPSKSELINASNLARIAQILIDEEELDFSQYKASTISRRIYRRCLIHNLHKIDDYIELLGTSKEERQTLSSDLLINVTHFFRDYPAWQSLENNVLPRIIAESKNEAELRFWITACSTGEEAYSFAILVHEALQDCEKNFRVKIFATDIDRSALERASQGIYPPSIATDIDPERLQRYFILKDNSYQVMRKIREMLIFSPHDLTKDAGFTRVNLIACRNVLIYMKSNLQYQVLRNLHFSLVHKGYLFLGEAETLGDFESEFETLDQKWKFFQKRRDVRLPMPLRSSLKMSRNSLTRMSQSQTRFQLEPILEQCLSRIAEETDAVILLISRDNHLLHVSGNSSRIFKAPDGRISTEITKMVVQPLALPINTALHRAKQQNKSIIYQGIQLEDREEVFNVDVEVVPPPLNGKYGNFYLVRIREEKTFKAPEVLQIDNTELDGEAAQRIMELETELQQTRENLQALVEELETINEEQQASNEELTASNEELQSTNEELHSVNEELHTVNIEYQSKISELTQLNDDVDNLLQSTEIGVVFLDAELKIRKFTPAVKSAIALRSSDLDRPLNELYWKFDCSNLQELLHEVLESKQPKELEVKLKKEDSYFLMQIHLYRTESQNTDGLVVSFIKIDEIKQVQRELEREVIARQNSEKQLRITQQRVENIFSSLEDAIWSFDLPARTLGYLNDPFERIYGRTKAEFFDNASLWLEVIHQEDRARVAAAHQVIQPKTKLDLEYRILHRDGSIRWVRDRSKIICDDAGQAIRQDFVITDITEQRRAEQALKAREQSFQAIFNSMFQFIGVLDTEGTLLEANRTALEFAGLTPEEALNRPFWEVKWWQISPETQAQLQDAIARAAEGEFIRYEVDVLGAGDTISTIDFSIKPVTDETGKVVQLIPEGREIGELKQAREELKENNLQLEQRVLERTASLAEFSDRLEQLHRLATSRYASHRELLADYLETGCQMFGIATGLIIQIENNRLKIVAGKSPWDLEVEYEIVCRESFCENMPETEKTVAVAELVQEHPFYAELSIQTFIGTPISVNDHLYGTLNFADTEERKSAFTQEEIKIIELMARDIGNFIAADLAQTALEQSNIRFRNTFEQAAVGVAHVSTEGRFIKVNQRLCEMLDYTNDVLLSKTFQEITHPDDLDGDLEYFYQVLDREIENYSLEKRYFRRDNSILWINLTVSLVRDSLGEPDYFIAVIEDIGDRKKIELDLQQSHLQLEQANQAKDNFIAHMSHEFRTPLNSTIGFSSILEKDERLIPEHLKLVKIIHRSGQHLLTLINDVLDLSKLNANKVELIPQELNLIVFLRNIIDVFQTPICEKNLSLTTNLSENLPKIIIADETRLRQVLFNLLSNAVKFTTAGTITLSVSYLESNGSQQTIRFEVRDTGRGIPESELKNVFIPFEQLEKSRGRTAEGTGLGLSICQNILELMNSELYLTSQVGQGSQFYFDLKLPKIGQDLSKISNRNLVIETLNQQPINSAKFQSCKVLVVDDNADNRLLLIEYLQSWGFRLREAENGLDGVKIAQEWQPNLILMDLFMPVMDGEEAIAAIKANPDLEDTAIFLITANPQSIKNHAEINCDHFLSKPVDFKQLFNAIKSVLEGKNQSFDSTSNTNSLGNLEAIVTPTADIMEQLLQLTYMGQMKQLKQQVDLLVESDPQYSSFADLVRQLAENCQQNELEELLKKND